MLQCVLRVVEEMLRRQQLRLEDVRVSREPGVRRPPRRRRRPMFRSWVPSPWFESRHIITIAAIPASNGVHGDPRRPGREAPHRHPAGAFLTTPISRSGRSFFTELGAEVVVSDPTNKKILQDGLNRSSSELWPAHQAAERHIVDLAGRCDFVFLPYIISTQKGSFYCPKLIATPDIAKAAIPGLSLMSADVDIDNFFSSLFSTLREIASKLCTNPMKIYAAYRKALERQEIFEGHVHGGAPFEEALSGRGRGDRAETARAARRRGRGPSSRSSGTPTCSTTPYISFDLLRRLRERGRARRHVRHAERGADRGDALRHRMRHALEPRQPRRRLRDPLLRAGRRTGSSTSRRSGCSSDSLIKEYWTPTSPRRSRCWS